MNTMQTRSESKLNSQLDKANIVLLELSLNISSEDKKEAAKEFGFHGITIRRYLKGKGTDLDTATNLIQFFKKRISERERKLVA